MFSEDASVMCGHDSTRKNTGAEALIVVDVRELFIRDGLKLAALPHNGLGRDNRLNATLC